MATTSAFIPLSISQKLNDVSMNIFTDYVADHATLDDWYNKIHQLSTQITILKTLALTARLVRQGGALPVRKLTFNVKILSQTCNKENSNGQSRWAMLQKLGCEAVVFCALSLNGISTLPSDHFAWLVENGRDYIKGQGLPPRWIVQEQIRKVVAGIPREESTKSFLKSYHEAEVELLDSISTEVTEQEVVRKRRRTESTSVTSLEMADGPPPAKKTNCTVPESDPHRASGQIGNVHHPPTAIASTFGISASSVHAAVFPLTERGAEVLLLSVREGGHDDRMTLVLPHAPGYFPYIILSYSISANIMRLYTPAQNDQALIKP